MEGLKEAFRSVQSRERHCCPRHAGAAANRPRSNGLWRPWLKSRMDSALSSKRHRMPYGSLTGRHGQYSHPVRLFWPKSKCSEHLFEAGEALLTNFPVQATISFYEESDSESEDDSGEESTDSGIESG